MNAVAETNLFTATVERLRGKLSRPLVERWVGRIIQAGNGRLETNLVDLPLGSLCRLGDVRETAQGLAVVIGVTENSSILSPIGPTDGLSSITRVFPDYAPFRFHCGPAMIGGVFDGLGRPVDGRELDERQLEILALDRPVPDSFTRPLIDRSMNVGIRVIDSMLTCGRGQRVSVLGPPGAGKSSFLGAITRGAEADLCVMALIGERGRELREFLDRELPPAVRERCIVFASTSDRPAMERVIGARVAVATAEYFRDRGMHVMLLVDSLTRYARALREIGLASGEAGVRRGFPPSVYAELPRLIERGGRSPQGDITAFYSVLLENDGLNDPIAEEVVSLTDGHIMLAGKLAQAGQFPAVDVLRSTSRVMNAVVPPAHREQAQRVRKLMAKYEEIELLVQVGEFAAGKDALADEAIAKRDELRAFFRQTEREPADPAATLERLAELADG